VPLFQQRLQRLRQLRLQRGHPADGYAKHQPRVGVQRVANLRLERIQPAEAVVRVRTVSFDAAQASALHNCADPVARVVFGQVRLRHDRPQRTRLLKRFNKAANGLWRGGDVSVGDHKRLVADERQRAEHGICRARRRVLANKRDGQLEIVQRGAHRRLMHADHHNQPLDACLL
jgi:hypothetical protein